MERTLCLGCRVMDQSGRRALERTEGRVIAGKTRVVTALPSSPPMRWLAQHRLGVLSLLTLLVPLALAKSASAEIAFDDVSTAAGFSYVGESWGAAWGDYDGDGCPDLFVTHHRDRTVGRTVHRNRCDGTFQDVTETVDASGTLTGPDDPHAVTWGDFDNDGDQDLLVSANPLRKGSSVRLYESTGGRLIDRTLQYGVRMDAAEGRMAPWLDYDNDGKLDFALMRLLGDPAILMRQENGLFVDRTLASGLACKQDNYLQLVDLTGDGVLDLVCGHRETALNWFPDAVFDISTSPFADLGNLLPRVPAFTDSLFADLDNDLAPDAFVVTGDMRPNEALIIGGNRIEASLTIIDNSIEKGFSFGGGGRLSVDLTTAYEINAGRVFIGAVGRNPASLTFALDPTDPANAGLKAHRPGTDQGIYIGFDPALQRWQLVASSVSAYVEIDASTPLAGLAMIGLEAEDQPMRPVLLRNAGGIFVDATNAAGLGAPVSCASAAAGDFDNDADLDIYLVCRGGVQNLPNMLYENLGNGRFQAVSGAGGASGPVGAGLQSGAGTGEAVTLADYDMDGFLDLFVTNGLNMRPRLVGGPDRLYRNRGNANHWIEIDLVGTASNRDGIGARVLVTRADGLVQLREQNGGYQRTVQHFKRLHFGLGPAASAVTPGVNVRVEWPSGVVDRFDNLPADQIYALAEGSSANVPRTLSVADVTVGEGAGVAEFLVRIAPAPGSGEQVTVSYATADGSALAGFDYLAQSGALSFVAGQTELIVRVPIIDDPNAESAEQLTFTVSGAGMTAATATATILDNDLQVSGCGAPSYVPSKDAGLYLWEENCGSATRSFKVRASGGGGVVVSYAGQLDASSALSSVAGFSVEPDDTLQVLNGGLQVRYRFNVRQWYQDGFNFNAAVDANLCFGMELPAGTSVLVGPNATPVAAPFDLTTYRSCAPTQPPLGVCGAPVYDAAADAGLYLWEENCGGATRDYVVRASAGSSRVVVTYAGQVLSDQALTGVAGFALEIDDVLNRLDNGLQVQYRMNVRQQYQDGFAFSAADGAAVCFGMNLPAGTPVRVGPNATPVSAPFSLPGLGACAP